MPDTMKIDGSCPTCGGALALRIGHMTPHCSECGWWTNACTCVIGPAVPAPEPCRPVVEVLATSLGRLSESEFERLRNRWARGIDWVVQKLGKRHWQISGPAFEGWPLYRTKRAAYDAATNIILQEARNRAILRQQEEVTA